jgi:hypothetical protein
MLLLVQLQQLGSASTSQRPGHHWCSLNGVRIGCDDRMNWCPVQMTALLDSGPGRGRSPLINTAAGLTVALECIVCEKALGWAACDIVDTLSQIDHQLV